MKGMSSVTLSSHKRATETSSHRRQGVISPHISKVLPPADHLLSFLISFLLQPTIKNQTFRLDPKMFNLEHYFKIHTADNNLKGATDFGMCIRSIPSILIHVSPQARSKVSVTLSDDQISFVGAEPQCYNLSVLSQLNVTVVLYQQRYSFYTADS